MAWQELGLTFSFLLGSEALEMSPLKAEHGRRIGLERKMIIYIMNMLSLSCLWDLKGKRCVVLGELLSLGLGFLICKMSLIILPTICVSVIFNEIKHIQC